MSSPPADEIAVTQAFEEAADGQWYLGESKGDLDRNVSVSPIANDDGFVASNVPPELGNVPLATEQGDELAAMRTIKKEKLGGVLRRGRGRRTRR
jgi:hypothetical protein